MAIPFPLTGESIDELKPQLFELIRQVYEDKIGGASLGDVFSVPGEVLTLNVSDTGGITKSGTQLELQPAALGGLQTSTAGVGIKLDGGTLTLGASGLKVTTPAGPAHPMITVSAVAPSGPAINDLWVDIS